MFNSTKAKHDSHGVWWCMQRTTVEVSMKRVFGVTVSADITQDKEASQMEVSDMEEMDNLKFAIKLSLVEA